jgi:capsular polysaccharide biosynthesis protein
MPPLVIAVLLASAVTFVVSTLLPKVYEAEATLIVGASLSGSPDLNELQVSERLAGTYATVATTRPILEQVRRTLELEESISELKRRLSAEAGPRSELITITGRAGDPEAAAMLVNTLVDALVASSPTGGDPSTALPRSVDEQLAELRSEIESAQARQSELAGQDGRSAAEQAELGQLNADLQALRQTYAALVPYATTNAPNLLTVVDPAVPPGSPAAPRPEVNAMVAAMAATLIVGTVAFVLEYPARTRGAV